MGTIGSAAGLSFIDKVRYYTRKGQMQLINERYAHPAYVGPVHQRLRQARLEARREFLRGVNVLV